jgi:predicted Zn-dependent peptidase
MSRIGKSELVYGKTLSFDEILTSIKSVNSSDIRVLSDLILRQPPTLAVVGPFSKSSEFEKVMK